MVEQLRATPLFASVPEEDLEELGLHCETRRYRRGDPVWQVGDPGDELVIVISGSLDVWAGSAVGPVARLGPGEYAGELALLLDESRSATVTCSRATELLCVPQAALRDLVRRDPEVLRRLTDLVSRRAMTLARGEVPAPPPVVVAVAAHGGASGASLVASAVADLGASMVPALLVRVVPGGTTLARLLARGAEPKASSVANRAVRLDVDLDLGAGPGDLVRLVEHLVTGLTVPARLIVIDLPRGSADAGGAACDAVVVVSDAQGGAGQAGQGQGARVRYEVINAHPGADGTFGPLNHSEPFFLRNEPALRGLDAGGAVEVVLATPRLAISRTLGRLTRKLLGVSVGIAMGGGAAYGIAHVGILAALEEAGLPVDLVAGTSMGSIIAIGHAAGLSATEMTEIAGRIGNVRTTLSVIDPTLSGAGLLNGRRLVSIFSPLLSQQYFDELVVPCRVVAMDVETGERVDIGTGRLDRAFRASCSIPLVFIPVKDGERTLVDGGMIDPVPVDVARDMGADIVVGVNVVPKLERGVSSLLSRTFKRVNRLNPLAHFGGGRDLPDLVDVLMNSLQVVEYELGEYKQLAADVRVSVPLAEFTWIEFYRAVEIIERGREAGKVAVEGLRAELDRRLATGV